MSEYSIILLPGLDGTGRLFDPLIEWLPQRINPVAVSYPGNQCRTYLELKDIVMPMLPENEPFFIMGESFSGPLSVMVAGESPPGLKGLILCATFIKNPFILLPSWLRYISRGPLYRLWPLLISIRKMAGEKDFREIAGLILSAIKEVSPEVVAHRVRSILSADVEEELKCCPCPVLYLMAGRDKLIRKHNYIKIKKARGDISLAVIDTLHFILQTEPEKAAEILLDFMDGVIQRGANR